MKKTGFTLIEMVVVLLLVGLLVFSVALSVLPATEAILLVRRNVSAAQKAQLALGRLVCEFTAITNVVSGSAQSLVYDMVDPAGITQRRTVAWTDGGALTLNAIPLSDDVAAFTLRYYESADAAALPSWSADAQLIEISLQSRDIPVRTFVNRVCLRDP